MPSESTSGLVELEKRLETASGPDRQIDALLWGLYDDRPLEFAGMGEAVHKRCKDDPIAFDAAPKFTASIDAALALVSRALPGAEYEITTLYGPAHVQLPLNGDECSDGRREDGNVPLAICLALVRALVAQAAPKASVP